MPSVLSPNGCTISRDVRIVREVPCALDRIGGFQGGYGGESHHGLKRR